MLRGQMIKVVWLDAQDHPDTWADVKDVEDFTDADKRVVSVGHFIRKTQKYLSIAGDMDEVDGDCGRVCKIPVGWIEKISILAEVSA